MPLTKNGLVKALFVAGASLLLIVAVVGFYSSATHRFSQEKAAPTRQGAQKAEVDPDKAKIEEANRRAAQAQADLALQTQAQALSPETTPEAEATPKLRRILLHVPLHLHPLHLHPLQEVSGLQENHALPLVPLHLPRGLLQSHHALHLPPLCVLFPHHHHRPLANCFPPLPVFNPAMAAEEWQRLSGLGRLGYVPPQPQVVAIATPVVSQEESEVEEEEPSSESNLSEYFQGFQCMSITLKPE